MPDKTSVLVIGEETTCVQNIANDLSRFGFRKIKVAGNFDSALKAIHDNDFNIAILSILFNGKPRGIELSKIISLEYGKPFIFITNNISGDIIRKAALTRPSAVLTTPLTPESLLVNIQSAVHYYHPGPFESASNGSANYNTFFFVKQGNKYQKIEWQNVVCLQSQKNYTCIITNEDESFLIRSSLQKTMREVVPEHLKDNFIQINRAEVLQMTFIEEIINNEVKTPNQHYSITSTYVASLKQKLNIVL